METVEHFAHIAFSDSPVGSRSTARREGSGKALGRAAIDTTAAELCFRLAFRMRAKIATSPSGKNPPEPAASVGRTLSSDIVDLRQRWPQTKGQNRKSKSKRRRTRVSDLSEPPPTLRRFETSMPARKFAVSAGYPTTSL